MHRKATKNTSAVPKSLIRARQPTQNAENSAVKIRLRRANRRSSVAAPTSTNTSFTSSEGCTVSGPTAIQFLAPKMR